MSHYCFRIEIWTTIADGYKARCNQPNANPTKKNDVGYADVTMHKRQQLAGNV